MQTENLKVIEITSFQSSSITGKPVILFSTRHSSAVTTIYCQLKDDQKYTKVLFHVSEIPSSTVVVVFTTCKSSFLVIKSPTAYVPFLG